MRNLKTGFSILLSLLLGACSSSGTQQDNINPMQARFFSEKVNCNDTLHEVIVLTPSECHDCILKNIKALKTLLADKDLNRVYMMDDRMFQHLQDSIPNLKQNSVIQILPNSDFARYGMYEGPILRFKINNCVLSEVEKLVQANQVR